VYDNFFGIAGGYVFLPINYDGEPLNTAFIKKGLNNQNTAQESGLF